MKKLVSCTIKTEKGFLKKPDIYYGIYLTYNMLHKPAILGMLGAIIGLEPIDIDKDNFQKTVIYYSNTTGFTNSIATQLINEHTLINLQFQNFTNFTKNI